MAVTEFLSIDAVVAEAASEIKNVTEQEKTLMRQWGFRAMLRIGVNRPNIEVSDPITVSSWSALKPTNLFKTLDLAVINSQDREIVTIFKGRGQVDTAASISRVHEDVRAIVSAIYVTEDDTYFNIEEFDDVDPTGITVVVRYLAFPVDSNGMPKIPEIAVMAVIAYIRYQWTKRERRSLAEVQEARHSWLSERAAADAEMHTPSVLEGKEIARSLNSMIQKVVVRDRQF